MAGTASRSGIRGRKGSAKTKPSAFYCFMTERKRELEETGFAFSDGQKEIVARVGDEWKHLNADVKNRYKSEALHRRRRYQVEKKPMQQYPLPLMKRPSHLQPAGKEDEDMIRVAAKLPNTPVFLKINECIQKSEWNQEMLKLLWATPEGKYKKAILVQMNLFVAAKAAPIPCEIAMVVYNIYDGLLNSYWSLVDPGDIPKGYGIEALKNAKYYGVNPPKASNIHQVVKGIEDFLESYPDALVFAPSEEMKISNAALNWMYDLAGKKFLSTIYPFEQQLVAMSTAHLSEYFPIGKVNLPENGDLWMTELTKNKDRVAGSHLTSHPLVALCGSFICESAAEEYMKVMNYIHLEELACQHHNKDEIDEDDSSLIYCALLHAKRMVYLALDAALINYPDVKIVRRKHFPDV